MGRIRKSFLPLYLSLNGAFFAHQLCLRHWAIGYGRPVFAWATACAAFVALSWLVWKEDWAGKTLRRATLPLCIAALLATAVTYDLYRNACFAPFFDLLRQAPPLSRLYALSPSLLLIPAACLLSVLPFVAWCWALERITAFFRHALPHLSKAERAMLCGLAALSICGIGIVYARTTLFTSVLDSNYVAVYDVVFTSDSAALSPPYFAFGLIQSPENDLKNPLFGLFTLPFHVLAECAARLFPASFTYSLAIAAAQALFLCFSFLYLLRTLALSPGMRCLLLALYMASYPFLLFSLLMEQYAVATAFLLLFLGVRLQGEEESAWPYAAMTGSLLTSGVCAVLLVRWQALRSGRVREALAPLVKPLLCLATLFVCSGQWRFCLSGIGGYARFIGGGSRIAQYVNLVATCFFPAQALQARMDVEATGQVFEVLRQAVVSSIHPLGLALLALAVGGFWLNRRERLAQICLGWLGFSAILFLGLGYGMLEGSLVLYSLYFSWAFLLLICMGINRLLEKRPALRYACYGLLVAALLAVNLPAIAALVQFGINHYPLVS